MTAIQKFRDAIHHLRQVVKAGYNPAQPRGQGGRWTAGGGGGGGGGGSRGRKHSSVPETVQNAWFHVMDYEGNGETGSSRAENATRAADDKMDLTPEELVSNFSYRDDPEPFKSSPIDWGRVDRHLKTLSDADLRTMALGARDMYNEHPLKAKDYSRARWEKLTASGEGEYAGAALRAAWSLAMSS